MLANVRRAAGSSAASAPSILNAPAPRSGSAFAPLFGFRVTALASQAPISATSRVLVVDDDPSVCAVYDRVLRERGYAVVTATSRESALSAIETLDGSFDVVVVDVNLRDTECTDLTREIAERVGPRPTLYVSAWSEEFLDLSDAPGRWLVVQLPMKIPAFVAAIEWLSGRATSLAAS
jgi:CheY-like chemotaxis protein